MTQFNLAKESVTHNFFDDSFLLSFDFHPVDDPVDWVDGVLELVVERLQLLNLLVAPIARGAHLQRLLRHLFDVLKSKTKNRFDFPID
jgi:hypothetical protein